MSAEADILDQASELTETLTAAYISNVRDAAMPEQKPNPDGTYPHPDCVECECAIPEGRLKLGKIRCIECQSFLEHAAAGRARG